MQSILNILVGLTIIGAILSIMYWTPETMQVIDAYGIKGAIMTTHLIRIFIDVVTIVTVLYLVQQNTKLSCDSKLKKY